MTQLTEQQLAQFQKLYINRRHPNYTTSFADWLTGALRTSDRLTQLDTLLETIENADRNAAKWLKPALLEAFTPQLLRIIRDKEIDDALKERYLVRLNHSIRSHLMRFLFAANDASTLAQVLPAYSLLFHSLDDANLTETLGRIYGDYPHKFNGPLLNTLSSVIGGEAFVQFLTAVSVDNKPIINHLSAQLTDLQGISGSNLYSFARTGEFLFTAANIATIPHKELADFFHKGFIAKNKGNLVHFGQCSINKAMKVLLGLIEDEKPELARQLFAVYQHKQDLLDYFFIKNRYSALLTLYPEKSPERELLTKELAERFADHIKRYNNRLDAKTRQTFVRVMADLAENHLDVALACYRSIAESPAKYLFFSDPKALDSKTPINRLSQLRLVGQLEPAQLKQLDRHKPGYLDYLPKLYQIVTAKVIDNNTPLLIEKAATVQVTLDKENAKRLMVDWINQYGLQGTVNRLRAMQTEVVSSSAKTYKAFAEWLKASTEANYAIEQGLLNSLLTLPTAFKNLANTLWMSAFGLDTDQPKIDQAGDTLSQYTLAVQAGLLNITNDQVTCTIMEYFLKQHDYSALATRLFTDLAEDKQHFIFNVNARFSPAEANLLLAKIYDHAVQKSEAQAIIVRLFTRSILDFAEIDPATNIPCLLFSSDTAFPANKRAQLIDTLTVQYLINLLPALSKEQLVATYNKASSEVKQKIASHTSEDTLHAILIDKLISNETKSAIFANIKDNNNQPDIPRQAELLHRLLMTGQNDPSHKTLALDLLKYSSKQAALAFALIRLIKQSVPSTLDSDVLNACLQNDQQAAANLCDFVEIYTAKDTDKTKHSIDVKTYQTIINHFFHLKDTNLIRTSLDSMIQIEKTANLRNITMSYLVDTQSDRASRNKHLANLLNGYKNKQKIAAIFSILANTSLESDLQAVLDLLKAMPRLRTSAFINYIDSKQLASIFNHAYLKENKTMDASVTGLFKLLSADAISKLIQSPSFSEEQSLFFFESIKDLNTQAEVLSQLPYVTNDPLPLAIEIIKQIGNMNEKDKDKHLTKMIHYLYDKHQLGIDPRPLELANLLFAQLLICEDFANALKIFHELESKITADIWQRLTKSGLAQLKSFYTHLLKRADSADVATFIIHLDIEDQVALLIALSNHPEAGKSKFDQHLREICAIDNSEKLRTATNIIRYLFDKEALGLAESMFTKIIEHSETATLWNSFDRDATDFFIKEWFEKTVLLKDDAAKPFLGLLVKFICKLESSAQADSLLLLYGQNVPVDSAKQAYYTKLIDALFHNDNDQLGADDGEKSQYLLRAEKLIRGLIPDDAKRLLDLQKNLIQDILASIAKGLDDTEMKRWFVWLIQHGESQGIQLERARIICKAIGQSPGPNQQFKAALDQVSNPCALTENQVQELSLFEHSYSFDGDLDEEASLLTQDSDSSDENADEETSLLKPNNSQERVSSKTMRYRYAENSSGLFKPASSSQTAVAKGSNPEPPDDWQKKHR